MLRVTGLDHVVLNVADRPTRGALAAAAQRGGGFVIEAGAEANRATQSGDLSVLDPRVGVLFAPVVIARVRAVIDGRQVTLGQLRAGEELVWEGEARSARLVEGPRARTRPTDDVVARGLAARADPQATEARSDGGRADDARPGRGIPAESVLTMLRQRVMPVARLCFRTDRRGRADYSVRAELRFTLADREVERVEVDGRLSRPLRSCLTEAVDVLDIPPFSGRIGVRWPLRTERLTLPTAIALEPDIATDVNAVTSGIPSTPPSR